MGRLIQRTFRVGLFLVILTICIPATMTLAGIKGINSGSKFYETKRDIGLMKILSVLEKRIENQTLLEKAKQKLLTVKDSEFVWITALSEQITKDGEQPGVNLAFLLITALIILS